MSRFRSLFIACAIFAGSVGFFPVHAQDFDCDRILRASHPVRAERFEKEVSERLMSVPEFSALRELCEQKGVRCWLFGGTAAGFAHYVKWDLMRIEGDRRFQKDRFDYDFTNIFRSTQDADLVIDGTDAQASEIEKILAEKFPHFQGSKSVWEVRLLQEQRGDKLALLENPEFHNQHTDSNSTGMIEVTPPKSGETVIRDLRDWNPAPGERPEFFEDVLEGKLHFYFSDLHGETARFKEGKNPPIFSVIRYLTKAFQYELEILPGDEAKIRSIIESFDPPRDLADPYAQGWIEKNGKKMFQHAVNLEYAWNRLESLGLRRKLIEISDPKNQGTMGWWLNREPLRSNPVGEGDGPTAREIGLEVVGHETVDFLAYESITRAHTGDPNVFESRENVAGESAYYGQGFYAAAGRKGARGTGLTIRFDVHPDAREGRDFFRVSEGQGPAVEGEYFVFRNKNALRVIQESLNIGPVQYFELLSSGRIGQDSSDRGIQEKLHRRIRNWIRNISDAEKERVIEIATQSAELKRFNVDSQVVIQFREHFSSDSDPRIGALLDRMEEAWLDRFHNNPEPGTEDVLIRGLNRSKPMQEKTVTAILDLLYGNVRWRLQEVAWETLNESSFDLTQNVFLKLCRLATSFNAIQISKAKALLEARVQSLSPPEIHGILGALQKLGTLDRNPVWALVLELLGKAEAPGQQVIERLEEWLNFPNPLLNDSALELLKKYRRFDSSRIELLLLRAYDRPTTPEMRFDAATSFRDFELHAQAVLDRAFRKLNEEPITEFDVRWIQLIEQFGADDPRSIPFMKKILESKEMNDRAEEAMLRILAKIGAKDPQTIRWLLDRARDPAHGSGEHAAPNLAVAAALVEAETLREEVTDLYLSWLDDPSVSKFHVTQAIRSLSDPRWASESHLDRILKVYESTFGRPDSELILDAALNWMASVAPWDSKVQFHLANRLLKRDSAFAEKALKSQAPGLGKSVLWKLVSLLQVRDLPWTRSAALSVLRARRAQLAERHPEARALESLLLSPAEIAPDSVDAALKYYQNLTD